MDNISLYLLALLLAFGITFLLTPLFCKLFGTYLKDTPTTLKNHKGVIPMVGGVAIGGGFVASLVFIRFATSFPSGTLRNLRGIFLGAIVIFILGLIDDIRKPRGLNAWVKLSFQALAACCLIYFGVKVQFVPEPFASIITILWVCGLTNAFNLLDIQDGLATSQAFLAATAFALISLPSENIYVNFLAVALMGATLGFWPYNHARKLKTFLGDSGSTLLGFLLAALALGVDYSIQNHLAVFAPILILALPIFDTTFVSIIRVSKGVSPLHGTPDHFPLRLAGKGLKKSTVLLLTILVTLCLDTVAFLVTSSSQMVTAFIYGICILIALIFALYLRDK